MGGKIEQKYFVLGQVRTVLPVVGRETCWEGDPILHLEKAHPEIATKVFVSFSYLYFYFNQFQYQYLFNIF